MFIIAFIANTTRCLFTKSICAAPLCNIVRDCCVCTRATQFCILCLRPSVLKIMNNSNWDTCNRWLNCCSAVLALYQLAKQLNSLIGKIVFSWCCFLVYTTAPYRTACTPFTWMPDSKNEMDHHLRMASFEAYFTFHFTHQLQAHTMSTWIDSEWVSECTYIERDQAFSVLFFIERECDCNITVMQCQFKCEC